MKANIHPQYYPTATVTCTSCGNTFTTGSTKPSITVEVCYRCHPFYTGEHKYLDTKGRVEMFQKKQAAAQTYKATSRTKKHKKTEGEEKRPKTLRELLSEV
ncbi:50S ribosomal protein L31 [Candidatus Roizmanbacteria bacterium]|nr:50S ribosomal protein L31 [Candidatus Roizmanbacteria bacterium]